MSFTELAQWDRSLVVDEDFIIKGRCNLREEAEKPGGYSINFQQTKDEQNGIILHFNPRAPSQSLVLNTLRNENNKKKWGLEKKIEDNNVKETFFVNDFKLKVRPLADNLIRLSVNGQFLTEYECTGKRITDAKFLVYSPSISIQPE